MKKFLLLLFPTVLAAQTPPQGNQPQKTQQQTPGAQLGAVNNNQGFTQSKSFAPPPPPPPPSDGGSKVRLNPFLSTADFAFIANPSFEGGYRAGLSLGTSVTNDMGTRGFGGSALLTTDLTQRAVTMYRSFISNGSAKYLSVSFSQIGKNQTESFSLTTVKTTGIWNYGAVANLSLGNGESFRIFTPTLSGFVNTTIPVTSKLQLTPEVFSNISDYYFDRDKQEWDKDFTVNVLTGTQVGYNITKRFVVNFDWRANINTNPRWGVMHNFLIGSNFKF